MHAVRLLNSGTDPRTEFGGTAIRDNARWPHAQPRLSVVIPTFRFDCSKLVGALAQISQDAEIIIHDDGSADSSLTAALTASGNSAAVPVRVVTAGRNRGRAGARNAAIRHARSSWVLLLDSDMLPDHPEFLSRYLAEAERAPGPCLVVGGYSLDQTPVAAGQQLARRQALTSECLPAATRARAPGRFVFTSNILVHRDILRTIPFDEGFEGWGWEDTEWGLRVAASHPVLHIDNTATHLGVDTDEALMAKYARSGANFARLVRQHPDSMAGAPLLRAARICRRLPFRQSFRRAAEQAARGPLPLSLRATALKAWRALIYAEHL
jgi:hypothetical protein